MKPDSLEIEDTRVTRVSSPEVRSTPEVRELGKTIAQPDQLESGWRDTRHAIDFGEGTLPDIPSPPGYELIKVLGHGGMGVVYLARQESLNRKVAIKCLLGGPHASPPMMARFQNEAELIAQLHHQQIVQIHEVGKVQGSLFYVMEYCAGGSLHDQLQGQPMADQEVAQLVLQLARAMAAAHRNQIIHRDLKPQNILLTVQGEPKISDFGLARHLSRDRMTETGKAIGTPWYMAPEQARGESDQIGPSVDIYALGAILYECLTGRPPFLGATPEETLRQVVESDPVPPRRWLPKLPRDLDTICMKCLQKSPSRRYLSMDDLAHDLENFLEHKPILARPLGIAERAVRWRRRNPTVATMVATVGCILLFAGVGMATLYAQALTERNTAQVETERAKEEKQRADEAVNETKARESEARRNLYIALMMMIARDWQQQDREQVHQMLDSLRTIREGDQDHRGWEWHLYDTLFDRSAAKLSISSSTKRSADAIAYTPKGDLLAVGTSNGDICLIKDVAIGITRRLEGHREAIRDLAWSPNGEFLASAGADREIQLWNRYTEKSPIVLTGIDANPVRLAWNRNGTQLAAVLENKTLCIWNPELSTQPLNEKITLASECEAIAWSPTNESLLLVAGQNGTIQLIDLQHPELTKSVHSKGSKPVRSLAWKHDGSSFLSGGEDGKIEEWNPYTCVSVRTIPLTPGTVITHLGWSRVASSIYVVTADATIQILDSNNGKRVTELHGHDQPINGLAIHPKLDLFATASRDGTVRVWGSMEADLPRLIGDSQSPSQTISWDQDGQQLLALIKDGTFRSWDRNHPHEWHKITQTQSTIRQFAIHPVDGRIACLDGAQIQIWDPKQDRAQIEWTLDSDQAVTLRWSPLGNLLAVTFKTGEIEVWETFQPKMRHQIKAHQGIVKDVSWNHDGERLASVGEDGYLRIWEPQTAQVEKSIQHSSSLEYIAWSKEGTLFLADSATRLLALQESAMELKLLGRHRQELTALACSDDGSRVAVGSADQSISIWDVQSKKRLLILPTQDQPKQLCWSKDNQALAMLDSKGKIQVWDLLPHKTKP
jgi:eukaryotic-like serine/threonine-protein kinase